MWFVNHASIELTPLSAAFVSGLASVTPADVATVRLNVETELAATFPTEDLIFTPVDELPRILAPADAAGPSLVRIVTGTGHDPASAPELGVPTIAVVDHETGAVRSLDLESLHPGDMKVGAPLTVPYKSPFDPDGAKVPLTVLAPLPNVSVCNEELMSIDERFCPSAGPDGRLSLGDGTDFRPAPGDDVFVFPRDWTFVPGRDAPTTLGLETPGGLLAISPFGLLVDKDSDFGHDLFPLQAQGVAAEFSTRELETPWEPSDDIQLALDSGNREPFDQRTRTWALQAQWWMHYASEVWQWNGAFSAPTKTRFSFRDKSDFFFGRGNCGAWRGWMGKIAAEDEIFFWVQDGFKLSPPGPNATDCDPFQVTARTIPHEWGHRIGGYAAFGTPVTGSDADPFLEHWADYVAASMKQMWAINNFPGKDHRSRKNSVWNFRGNNFYRSPLDNLILDPTPKDVKRMGWTGALYHGMHRIGAQEFDPGARLAIRAWAGGDLINAVGGLKGEIRELADRYVQKFSLRHQREIREALYDHDWIGRIRPTPEFLLGPGGSGFLAGAPEVADDYSNHLARATPLNVYLGSLTVRVTLSDNHFDGVDTFKFYAQEGRTYSIFTQSSFGVDPAISLWRMAPGNPQGVARVLENKDCADQDFDIPALGILANVGCSTGPGAMNSMIRFSPLEGEGGWYALSVESEGSGIGVTRLTVAPGMIGASESTGAPRLLPIPDPPGGVFSGLSFRVAIVPAGASNHWSIPVVDRGLDCQYEILIQSRGLPGLPSADRIQITSDVYDSIDRTDTVFGSARTITLTPTSKVADSGFIHVEVKHPDSTPVPIGFPTFPWLYDIRVLEVLGGDCAEDRSTLGRPFVLRRSADDSQRTDYFGYGELLQDELDDDYLEVELEEGEFVTVSVISAMGTMIDIDGVSPTQLEYFEAGRLPVCYEFNEDYSGDFDLEGTFSNPDCAGTLDFFERANCCIQHAAQRGYLSSANPVQEDEILLEARPGVNHLSFVAYADGVYKIRVRPYRQEVYPYRGTDETNNRFDTVVDFPAPYQINVAIAAQRQDSRPPYPVITPTGPGGTLPPGRPFDDGGFDPPGGPGGRPFDGVTDFEPPGDPEANPVVTGFQNKQPDAGVPEPPDAGVPEPDAGVPEPDAGAPPIELPADFVLGQPDFASNASGAGNTGLFTPQHAAYDPFGLRLFVTDAVNNRVLVYDTALGISDGMAAAFVLGQPDFATVTANTACGGGSAGFPNQCGMGFPNGVDIVGDTLMVADNFNARVLVYDLSGGIANGMAASAVLGQPDFTTNTGDTACGGGSSGTINACGMQSVAGTTIACNNNFAFVSDVQNQRIMVFDIAAGVTNGMPASFVLGQPDLSTLVPNADCDGVTSLISGGASACGVGPGVRVWLSFDERLFLFDTYNHRVLFHDLSAGITDFKPADAVLGQPDFTTGFVNDATSGANRSCDGLTTGTVNECGLNSAFHGVLDPITNALFVADTFNNRVVVFELSGGITNGMPASGVFGQPDFTTGIANNDCGGGGSSGVNECGLNIPGAVDFDFSAASRLFVTDTFNNRVLVFE